MKILTNIRFYKLAGIAQTLSSLASYIKKKGGSSKIEFVGVEMANSKNSRVPAKIKEHCDGNFRVVTVKMNHPDIKELATNSKNIGGVEKEMIPLVTQYKKIITQEKPDVILLNGTYYLPWCLFMAARNAVKNIVLHYHGSLSKETGHYPEHIRKIFYQMEKTFDSDNLRYIFPSLFAKNAVAKDVFGHEPKNFCILPNSIPLHFFDAVKVNRRGKKRIGAVARWRHVKNKSFFESFARHNARRLGGAIFTLLTDLRMVADVPSHVRRLIKFSRPMDNSKMAKFYSKMDLVICPSRFETYGNVAQEAIACGTPALISDKMGVAEQFHHFGLSKWVASFDKPSAIFGKIEQMMEETVDPQLRQELKSELNPDRIHGLLLNYIKSE